MTWRDKAHRVIQAECRREYDRKNKGKKKHTPYTVPELAEKLISCLRDNDEERAKSIFLYEVHR